MVIRVTNTSEGFIEDSSGLTQIATEPPPQSIGPSTRVGSGAVSWSALDNSALERGVTSYVHSSSGTPGGSVIATRQKVNGVDTVELQPGNPASRTAIKMAISDGLITETSPGFYQDTQRPEQSIQQQQQGQPQQEDAPQDPGAGLFDPQEDSSWAHHIEPLTQHGYDHAVASMVAVAAHSMGSIGDTAKALAKSEGMEHAQALALVEAGGAMYQRVADRAIAEVGIDGEQLNQFYEYAKRSQQRPLQDAVQRLLHARDGSGFKAMAAAWKASNADQQPQVRALKAAGFQTHVDRQTGQVLARKGTGNWVAANDLLRG